MRFSSIPVIDASALVAANLIGNAQLKGYKGGSHGICSTEKDQVNADMLAFFEAQAINNGYSVIVFQSMR